MPGPRVVQDLRVRAEESVIDARVAASDWVCDPMVVSKVRDWTSLQLRPWLSTLTSDHVGDAVLCVSELVTNAVNAGSRTMSLTLALSNCVLVMSLTDDADGWPVLGSQNASNVHGRGLLIIGELAQAWGADRAAKGKTVWAAFDWTTIDAASTVNTAAAER